MVFGLGSGDVSIKKRLTSIIMATSSIAVLLTTLTITIIGIYTLKADLLSDLQNSAEIVGDRNTAALLFNDDALADSNLQVYSSQPNILRACLYLQSGELFASYFNGAARVRPTCPDRPQPGAELGEQRATVTHRIVRMNDFVGLLYVESDLKKVNQYIEKQSFIAIAVTLAVLVISFMLALRLQRGISQPILNLAATAREVSVNKDYSVRANPFGRQHVGEKNEIKMFTDSFNSMLSEIGKRDRQLKQQNVELEKARDEAESANRAKSQFLANISHELRTPLNAIIGFSSIIMNELFGKVGDGKYLEYAQDINESGTHLLDVINDILDLAKAEAGRLELNLEEVNVARMMKKCMNLMKDKAEAGKIEMVSNIDKNLPALMVDRLRLIQIVLNVLSNAIKFTPQGGKVTLSVKVHRESSDGRIYMRIVITDTGIGMAKEDIDKAFQSFGQIDGGLNRKYEGSGMGLPLTRMLLNLHHGHLGIESEPNEGTTVIMDIPVVSAAEIGYDI